MLLQLKTPIVRTTTASQVEVSRIIDSPGTSVIAEVVVESIGPKQLTLWEGDAYTAIGQWTDTQAAARILEILDQTL